jgi:DNA repair photolyase
MIGVTERGDPAYTNVWYNWVQDLKRPAILISKCVHQMYYKLKRLTFKNVIVHCTITGFGGTILEPMVPKYEDSLRLVEDLADLIGRERIVIRMDPIILTPKGVINVQKINDWALEHGFRRRISFMDNYNHVKERFRIAGLPQLSYDFHAPLDQRLAFWNKLGKPEVCGEPGMPCSGCVSAKDLEILGVTERLERGNQRATCQCLAAKHELLNSRSQCPHGCLYCYWKS